MSDDTEVVATVLRRFIENGEYWCVGETFVSLDGRIDISPEERSAIMRSLNITDGQGWWNKR